MNHLTKFSIKSLFKPNTIPLSKRLVFTPIFQKTTWRQNPKTNYDDPSKEDVEPKRIFTKPKPKDKTQKDNTPIYIPKYTVTHDEATLPLVQDIISLLESLKTNTSSHNDTLKSIEKNLAEIFSINPFHCHQALKNNETALLKSITNLLQTLKGPEIIDFLFTLDKFRILNIPSFKNQIKNVVPVWTCTTFQQLLVKMKLGVAVEKEEVIGLFINQKDQIQQDERILFHVFEGLRRAFGDRFEAFSSDLFTTLEANAKFSHEDVQKLRKINSETELSAIDKVKAFQNDIEAVLAKFANKSEISAQVESEAERVLIYYIMNYIDFKGNQFFKIDPVLSLAENYLKSSKGKSPAQHMFAIYLIKSLTEIAKEAVTMPIKHYPVFTLNNWLVQIYAFENFQKRINRILEKTSTEEAQMNIFEQNLIAFMKDNIVTPNFISTVSIYLWAMGQYNLGSKEFYNQFEEILEKKVDIRTYRKDLIQIATSLARRKVGRKIIYKLLQTLSDNIYWLDNANKIDLLFVMAHSNMVFRKIYAKMDDGFRDYIADPTRKIDELVLLLYTLSKCGETKLNAIDLAFKKIESVPYNEIHTSKLVPFIWSCLAQKRYSLHFKSAVKRVVNNPEAWKGDALTHFAQCFYIMKETEGQLFEELGLAKEEKKLMAQLIVNGIKIRGGNEIGNKNLSFNEVKIMQKLQQEYPGFVEDAWIDGFFFDAYIPEKNLVVDFETQFLSQQDSDMLLGPTRMKEQVMKKKVENGELRYKSLSLDTQKAILKDEVNLFQVLGLSD